MNRGRIADRVLLVLMGGVLALTPAARAQELVWSDEFDSGPTLDSTIWSYDLGDGCSVGICGWGNAELQEYTANPANVRVEGGHLIITALREGPFGPFTSARVKTKDKIEIRYGTIEARIQLPDLADGLWPAFWTLGGNIDSVGWPACGEMDIFEFGNGGAIAEGVVNRRVGSTAHWDFGGYAGYGLYYTSPFDLNGSFHIYRMEWTPDSVSTFIDGNWIWTMNLTNPATFGGEEFHEPHFLLMNMAVGGNYTAILNESGITAGFPAEYRVDWVRVYDNGHTTLSGTGVPFTLSVDKLDGSDVGLTFDTQDGLLYEVRYKASPADVTWTILETVAGNGQTRTVYDTLDSPAAYYRIVARD